MQKTINISSLDQLKAANESNECVRLLVEKDIVFDEPFELNIGNELVGSTETPALSSLIPNEPFLKMQTDNSISNFIIRGNIETPIIILPLTGSAAYTLSDLKIDGSINLAVLGKSKSSYLQLENIELTGSLDIANIAQDSLLTLNVTDLSFNDKYTEKHEIFIESGPSNRVKINNLTMFDQNENITVDFEGNIDK